MAYHAANKFQTYNRSRDFTWYYGHAFHIASLLKEWTALNNDEKNNYVHTTILCIPWNKANVDMQITSNGMKTIQSGRALRVTRTRKMTMRLKMQTKMKMTRWKGQRKARATISLQ